MPVASERRWASGWTLAVLVVSLLAAAALSSLAIFWKEREAVLESHCQSNLTAIGCNMGAYQDRCGRLPAAHVLGRDGTRWHSWRVLCLDAWGPALPIPYEYGEPWNGPHNSALLGHRPQFYACASDRAVQRDRQLASYFVVEGRQTAFPGGGTTSLTDIRSRQGLAGTVLAVEAAGRNIAWLEPRDLRYEEIVFQLDEGVGTGIASPHPHGPYACMADGSVRSLRGVAPEVLKTMLVVKQPGDEEKPQ